MRYSKPHLTFDEQVEHLEQRGLVCSDPAAAVDLLARLGYYRFSAYAYPFRQLLAAGAPRETSVQFRADDFQPGTTFELVAEIARFDRRLRMLCLDGLEAIELTLRVRIAYVLGSHAPFGHLEVSELDEQACSIVPPKSSLTVYDLWLDKYFRLQKDAQAEDFVTHYVQKYDGQLPIWVAIEVMDFGSLVRLFGLLTRQDQNEIARAMGLPDGKLFARFLKSFNYLRNVSAHHSRLWNRNLTYKLPTFPETLVPLLGHIVTMPVTTRSKLYPALAAIAYLTNYCHPDLDWAPRARQLFETFPDNATVSLEMDAGFPRDWAHQEVWRASA